MFLAHSCYHSLLLAIVQLLFSDYGTSHGTVTQWYPFGLFDIRNRFLCIEISGWKSAPYPRLRVPAPLLKLCNRLAEHVQLGHLCMVEIVFYLGKLFCVLLFFCNILHTSQSRFFKLFSVCEIVKDFILIVHTISFCCLLSIVLAWSPQIFIRFPFQIITVSLRKF